MTGSNVGNARPVLFAKATTPGDVTLMNAEYDPELGLISYFAKARGPSDCGVQGAYAWNGQAFVLQSQTQLLTCNALETEWPTVWRTSP